MVIIKERKKEKLGHKNKKIDDDENFHQKYFFYLSSIEAEKIKKYKKVENKDTCSLVHLDKKNRKFNFDTISINTHNFLLIGPNHQNQLKNKSGYKVTRFHILKYATKMLRIL